MPPQRKHAGVSGGRQKKQRFMRKQRPQPSHNEETNSVNSLKSRIRNLKRLLGHLDENQDNRMPVTIRIEHERELEALEHELAEKEAEKGQAEFRKKIIGKYHHIRFFERQKATRALKRLTKKLDALTDESERAAQRQKIHNADVDLNYTIYYPLLKPYVSLFPKQEDNAAADKQTAEPADGPKGNVDMWKAVEKAMEDGTLEALRNSNEGVVIPGQKDAMLQYSKGRKGRKAPKDYERGQSLKHKKTKAPKEEEEDSDGGFFG